MYIISTVRAHTHTHILNMLKISAIISEFYADGVSVSVKT